MRDTGIGREREVGWEGGREGGVVKKVPMTHLKTVSAGNDTSTNIRESKRPGKRSGAAGAAAKQKKYLLIIKKALSRCCHIQEA